MSLQSRIASYPSFKDRPIPEFHKQDDKDVKNFRFPCINILDDIVLKKAKENEYENQKFFSDKVLDGICENFPLVYGKGEPFMESDSDESDESDDDKKEDYIREKHNKLIIAMEKFDGDYDEIQSEQEIDEYISLLLQILMTLYIIDSYGKYHGDLNPGNLLYKSITDESGSEHPGYLKYVIEGETYYVKHFNKLWVIADFEFMGEKGEVLLDSNKGFTENFFKRLFCDFYNKIKEPVKGSWIYDMYTFTHFSGALKMTERIFNFMQDGCTMNPVEAIPHIIKNDFDHLLLKNKP